MALSSKKKTNEYIVCCKCGDTQSFSRESFKLLFPGKPVPEQYLQPDLYKLLDKQKKNGNFHKYLSENFISINGAFSYYFEVNQRGDILSQYNLLTGKKVV